MKKYYESDYALNKHSPHIVYRFNDRIVEVKLDDYLKENPGMTEQDFGELKAISDQIYYDQDRADHAQTRKDCSLTGLEETVACATRPLDEEWEENLEEYQNRCLVWRAFEKLLADGVLTDIQKRRFYLHIFKGMSTRRIGKLEGKSHQAIAKSLNLVLEKYKKIFEQQI